MEPALSAVVVTAARCARGSLGGRRRCATCGSGCTVSVGTRGSGVLTTSVTMSKVTGAVCVRARGSLTGLRRGAAVVVGADDSLVATLALAGVCAAGVAVTGGMAAGAGDSVTGAFLSLSAVVDSLVAGTGVDGAAGGVVGFGAAVVGATRLAGSAEDAMCWIGLSVAAGKTASAAAAT